MKKPFFTEFTTSNVFLISLFLLYLLMLLFSKFLKRESILAKYIFVEFYPAILFQNENIKFHELYIVQVCLNKSVIIGNIPATYFAHM